MGATRRGVRQLLAARGSGSVVPADQLAGTWEGNGCVCSPQCIRLEIKPACGDGICVIKYCGGCPIPFQCQYMLNCGSCYTDCDNEGYWTPDRDHIDGRCGYGFVRAAPIQQEMKASQT